MSFITKVIQPTCFLNISAVTQFQSEMAHAIESGVDIVLVDLKNITSVSSATFIALVKGLKLAHKSDCQLVICSVDEQLKMLFELTGLDQVFKVLTDHHEVNLHLQPVAKVARIDSPKAA